MRFGRARQFARSLDLKTSNEWRRYCAGGFPKLVPKPLSIPKNPDIAVAYQGHWKGWVDWLGNGRRIGGWRNFKLAQTYVRGLKLRTSKAWQSFIKTGELPNDIPKKPWKVYKKEWKGMPDWLGSTNPRDRDFRPFFEARAFARSLKLKSIKEWQLYCSGKLKGLPPRPTDIPAAPAQAKAYKKNWRGWGDFLGTGNLTKKRTRGFNRKITFDFFASLAKQNGGRCLSRRNEFKRGVNSRLRFECEAKHIWVTGVNSIYQGRWCPECGMTYRSIMERRVRTALEHLVGFDLPKTRPDWLGGLELDGYNSDKKVAFEYQGRQHYEFVNYFHRTKAELKRRKFLDRKKSRLCKNKKVLLIRVKYLKSGITDADLLKALTQACEKHKLIIRKKRRQSLPKIISEQNIHLERLRTILSEAGYTLLSSDYKGHYFKLEIRCSQMHVYLATPADIKRGNKCPQCRGHIITIKELQQKAKVSGLKLLSTKYKGTKSQYKWKCKANKDHPFFLKAYDSRTRKNGIKCPFLGCSGNRFYIMWFKKKARANRGWCRTRFYKNKNQLLTFECRAGHKWKEAAYIFARSSRWCKQCSS